MTDYADPPTRRVMSLLADGVPLSLLIDIVAPPRSADIARSEGGAADWLPPGPARIDLTTREPAGAAGRR